MRSVYEGKYSQLLVIKRNFTYLGYLLDICEGLIYSYQSLKTSLFVGDKLYTLLFIKFFKQNHSLLIMLVIVWTLIWYSACQYTMSDCLYTQTFNIFDQETIQPYIPQGYTFQLTWFMPQENIIGHSYVLSGYAISTLGKFLSFDAALRNVTGTGAQFYFNPTNNSEILRANFTIILSKNCSGFIQLQLIGKQKDKNVDFAPKHLSRNTSRTSPLEQYNVTIRAPVRPDDSSYLSEVFISSYSLARVVNIVRLRALTKQFAPDNSYQVIEFTSTTSNVNAYTRISFTYILIDVATFSFQASYFNVIFSRSTPFTGISGLSNLRIPAVFNPYLGFKCIIGLKWIVAPITGPESCLFILNTGTNISSNFTNILVNNHDIFMYSQFCLQACSSNWFVNYTASTHICRRCSYFVPNCKTCINIFFCSSCASSYFLFEQKCYLACPPGYFQDTSNRICLNCTNLTNFQLFNGTCLCKNGFKLLTNICVEIGTCTTTTADGVCLWCDSNRRFRLNSSNLCQCQAGYTQDGDSCVTVCGDGKVNGEKCDDGNRVDGDGCSSNCNEELYYKCVNGTVTTPSVCIYSPMNIGLTLLSINKIALENVGVFCFKISPFLTNMLKLNLTSNSNFTCNQRISLRSVFLNNDGQLTLWVQFFEDLEGKPANFTLQLEQTYFNQKALTINFDMVSNGIKLLLVKDIQKIAIARKVALAYSLLILVIFALSLFTHKMIGVQIMNTLQIIYLSHLTNRDYTIIYSLTKNLAFVGFDFLSITNDNVSMYMTKQNMPYSKENLNLTISIMNYILLPSLAIAFIVLAITIIRRKDENSQDKRRVQVKDIFHVVTQLAYNNLVYPLSIMLFFIYFLAFGTKFFEDSDFSRLNIGSIVCISLVFFNEWKILIVQKAHAKYFTGFRRCKSFYIPLYLTLMLLSMVLIKASYLLPYFSPFLPLVGLYTIFMIISFVYKLYEDGIHNIGVKSQSLTVVYFCGWSALKDYGLIAQDEVTEVLLFFILMIMILALMIISVLRAIFQIKRIRLCYNNPKPAKRLSKKELMKSEVLGMKPGMFKGAPAREEYMRKIDIERHGKYNIQDASFMPNHDASRNLARKRLRTNYQELGAQFL